MIIDCHGHYTTTPPQHEEFRRELLATIGGSRPLQPMRANITDDEIRASITPNQLELMDRRGIDLTLFSPRAASMEHHVADSRAARAWAEACNNLIHRVVGLFPSRFIGVCQLPQRPDGGIKDCVAELERCVTELGFVGCNINPDPSGGLWNGPSLVDRAWYPLYERMVELKVPAMLHASASNLPAVDTLGGHYLSVDTIAFRQLLDSQLFDAFPELRFVIPHGGGAVPYHWGRYRGLAESASFAPITELLNNVTLDTCVYNQTGMNLLIEVIGVENLVFGSEVLGAVRGTNPATGSDWDDTKRYIDDAGLSHTARRQIYFENPLRVYPLLEEAISTAQT